ncbi:MAG: glycerophosphodiester phosphodiesterase [Nitrosomonas sp.]
MPESIQESSHRCLIYAHRGASSEAMENTREAFDKALHYAIDGIETDVQLTRDEIPVLWHDRFLDKIGLNNKHIDNFDHHQLQSMINAESYGYSLMTLQDFLVSFRERCRLLIEVKNRDWEPVSRHALKMQKTLDLIGDNSDQRIIMSSFNLPSLEYAHQLQPEFPLIYNIEAQQTIPEIRQLLKTHDFLHGFCLPIESLQQEVVELLREHAKLIGVYTCNSEPEISTGLHFSVDILISDVPQNALIMRGP